MTLSEVELKAFVGTYGEVSIRFEDHALWLQCPDRPTNRLTPMTRDGLFQALDNETLRVRIAPDRIEVLRIDPAYSKAYRKTS